MTHRDALDAVRGAYVPIKAEAAAKLPDPKKAEPKRVFGVADLMRQARSVSERVPTGIASLDRMTRGGPTRETMTVILGGPGSGKTTFSVSMLYDMVLEGACAVILACDEGKAGLLTRIGQRAGWSREDQEQDGEAGVRAREACADKLEELGFNDRLLLLDGDELTLEQAAKVARKHFGPDAVVIFLLDSLQTVRCEAGMEAASPRERVNATLETLKHIARSGFVVITISEQNRGAYRGGPDGKINTLASGKESGAIEYGASLMLALEPVKDEPGFVDVECPKNRLGPEKASFRLRIDFETAHVTEVRKPDEEAVQAAKDSERHAAIKAAVRRVFAQGGEIKFKTQLADLVDGYRRTDVLKVCTELEVKGAYKKIGGRLVWVGEASGEGGDDDL